jgi:dTDP-4-dehydrorhamnose reductase
MRRLVVTGATGFVAGSVISQAGSDWEVHAFSRGATLKRFAGEAWHRFDLNDKAELTRRMDSVAPDAVIHAAAIAGIDHCMAHKDEARQANVETTARLAALSAERGAKMVFVSSDNVFDGKRGMYAETDATAPVNFYGQTKVAGEQSVLDSSSRAVAARTALVMGLPALGSGNSFLDWMIPKLAAGEQVGIPENEIRSPIDVLTLGCALLELASNGYAGILHFAGNEALDRCEMVRRIAGRMGYDPGLVVANDPAAIPGRDERPLDVSLNNEKSRAVLDTQFLGLEDGLELVLDNAAS